MERKEDVYEDDLIRFEIKEGILYGTYKIDDIDLDIAKHATIKRLEFSAGKSYPTVADLRNVKNTDKDARDYLSTEEPQKGLTAIAILVDSPMGSMIGNFYIRIAKPPQPTKIFSNKAKALNWLKRFIKKR